MVRGIWAWDALPPEEGDSSAAAVYGHPACVGGVLAPQRPRPGAAWGCRAGPRGRKRPVRGETRGPTPKPSPGCTEVGPPVSPRTRRECEFRRLDHGVAAPSPHGVPGFPPVRSFPGPSPLLSSRGRRLRALGDSTTGLTQGEDFSPRA